VEARIIKIMKQRKTFSESNLIAEVTKQLMVRFMPSIPLIKLNIEDLISRDYLARENTNILYKA
jgi:cullin 3